MDVHFTLNYWLFIPQTWIIIGIIALLLEFFDGHSIFFLPISLAAFYIGLFLYGANTWGIIHTLLPLFWYWLIVWWMVLALINSILLAWFQRRKKQLSPDPPDINEY